MQRATCYCFRGAVLPLNGKAFLMLSIRKVGGLTFVSIGRVRISFCVAKVADLRPSKARIALALARCL